MSRNKIRFDEDPNYNLKIRCNIGLTIEPYGYRQGQRVAMISLDDNAEEVTLKQIVLSIYKLKTNCITIQGSTLYIHELVEFLQKFINYCKIHMNLVGMGIDAPIRFSKVLCTYDTYVEGMDENDTIVLFADTADEIDAVQQEAERIRQDYNFVGKVFIVHRNELDSDAYEKVLNNSVHYKTKYQRMY